MPVLGGPAPVHPLLDARQGEHGGQQQVPAKRRPAQPHGPAHHRHGPLQGRQVRTERDGHV